MMKNDKEMLYLQIKVFWKGKVYCRIVERTLVRECLVNTFTD